MSLRQEKSTKKNNPNYITAVISITLVLLNLGILGTALLLSKNLPNSIKENMEFQLELNDNLSQEEVNAYKQELQKENYFKSITYVSKEEAVDIMQKELGEDFKGLLGYNPLYASLNLKLNSEFIQLEKVQEIEKRILASGKINAVNYDADLINIVNKFTGKIILPLVGLAVLLLIIALFLIDSTIRLSMYSKRFLVRSMKLVGATEWFITKPFIKNGVFIGATSGILASVILIAVVFPIIHFFFNISVTNNMFGYVLIVLILIILGVFISLISTKRAVNKYLKLKLNDLY